MARILCVLRKSLNLRQRIVPCPLHLAADAQAPMFKINFGIINVVVVDRELFKGSNCCGRERRRQMAAAKQ